MSSIKGGIMSNTLGNNIKYYRTGLGMSQEYVASVCGIGQSAYAAYESGKKTPKIETVKEIAGALGVHPLLLYKDDYNNNRGYFYKLIMDNCLNIDKDDSGKITVTLDETYESLYDVFNQIAANKQQIREDYPKNTPEYIEKIERQNALIDYFTATWPEYDYSYKISINEEKKSRDIARRNMFEKLIDNFAAFFTRTRKLH